MKLRLNRNRALSKPIAYRAGIYGPHHRTRLDKKSPEVSSRSGVIVSPRWTSCSRISTSALGSRASSRRSGQRTKARLSCHPGRMPVARAAPLSASNGSFASACLPAGARIPQGCSLPSGSPLKAATTGRSGIWSAANMIRWRGEAERGWREGGSPVPRANRRSPGGTCPPKAKAAGLRTAPAGTEPPPRAGRRYVQRFDSASTMPRPVFPKSRAFSDG